MVLKIAALLALLAAPVAAGCLPAGKTPKRVMFDDGTASESIRRQGDKLQYTTYPQPGIKMTFETRWVIWPLRITVDGDAIIHDWGNARLPAPGDLAPGQEVTVAGQVAWPGQAPQDWPMTLRMIGPSSVTVAGCAYDVLHLWVRMGPAKGLRYEGERWLDPDRMVVWAHTTKTYGEDGKLEREVSAKAFAVD